MDIKGNVKDFATEQDAQKQNYLIALNDEEAKTAKQRPIEVRVYEYIYSRFEREILKDVKIDTFQKLRIKNAIKYTIAFFEAHSKNKNEQAQSDPLAKE